MRAKKNATGGPSLQVDRASMTLLGPDFGNFGSSVPGFGPFWCKQGLHLTHSEPFSGVWVFLGLHLTHSEPFSGVWVFLTWILAISVLFRGFGQFLSYLGFCPGMTSRNCYCGLRNYTRSGSPKQSLAKWRHSKKPVIDRDSYLVTCLCHLYFTQRVLIYTFHISQAIWSELLMPLLGSTFCHKLSYVIFRTWVCVHLDTLQVGHWNWDIGISICKIGILSLLKLRYCDIGISIHREGLSMGG